MNKYLPTEQIEIPKTKPRTPKEKFLSIYNVSDLAGGMALKTIQDVLKNIDLEAQIKINSRIK